MGVIQEKRYGSVKPSVETMDYGTQYVKVTDDDPSPAVMVEAPSVDVVDLEQVEGAGQTELRNDEQSVDEQTQYAVPEVKADEPVKEKKSKAGRPKKSNQKKSK